MLQWRDEGLILTTVRHGEESAVVHILTRYNGRTAGYLRSANTPKVKPTVQAGNYVTANWQARLPDQLGYFALEPVQSLAMPLMQSSDLSLALQTVTQMLLTVLPERQAYPTIFEGTHALLQTLHTNPNWAEAYIWWEIHLLGALGFGLRLDRCVQTEQRSDLTHVSPKSGHAVCRAEAAPYRDRLLNLPAFLGGADNFGDRELSLGLALTGYFLHQHITEPQGKSLPETRQRLAARLMQKLSPQKMTEKKYG